MNLDTQWVAGDQIQGGRDYQEDAYTICFLPPDNDPSGRGRLLLLLADGMGGHAGGDVASATVARAFREGFEEPAGSLAAQFNAGVDGANRAVREKQLADPALAEMGATLVAAVVTGSALYWVSVGDSLLWLCREGRLRRLNADHSMRPLLLDLVELGRLTEAEALGDPRVHQLRSVIYGADIPLIDMNADGFELENGDLVLLASDGLETLPEAALEQAIRAGGNDAGAIVRALLDGVRAAGKPRQDNATALVYRVGRENDSLFGTIPSTEESSQTSGFEQERQPESPDEEQPETAGKGRAKWFGLFATIVRVLSRGAIGGEKRRRLP